LEAGGEGRGGEGIEPSAGDVAGDWSSGAVARKTTGQVAGDWRLRKKYGEEKLGFRLGWVGDEQAPA
jgi:hypothetical protein